jgi:hypothetical protein
MASNNVCCGVLSPRYNLKKTDYLNFLSSLGARFMVGGDYRAKYTLWGSGLTTHKGKELYDAIKEYACEYHSTGKPTSWPTDENKIPDFSDFFITKKNIGKLYGCGRGIRIKLRPLRSNPNTVEL